MPYGYCERSSIHIASLGLEKNETVPIPVLPTPRTPSSTEKEQAVEILLPAAIQVRRQK